MRPFILYQYSSSATKCLMGKSRIAQLASRPLTAALISSATNGGGAAASCYSRISPAYMSSKHLQTGLVLKSLAPRTFYAFSSRSLSTHAPPITDFKQFAKSFTILEWDYDGNEIRRFQDAASSGHNWIAEAYLGVIHSVGTHRLIPVDAKKAQEIGNKVVPLLQNFIATNTTPETSDDQGNAHYLLALYHELGLGLTPNSTESTPNLPQALQHYLSAAKLNNLPAKQRLGDLTRYNSSSSSITAGDPALNFQHALTWYHTAAEGGFANAQFSLANAYLQGYPANNKVASDGNKDKKSDGRNGKDIPKALHWFRQAAAQGHLGAQYNLGWCLANGIMSIHQRSENTRPVGEQVREALQEGLQSEEEEQQKLQQNNEENLKEAIFWIKNAANHGHPSAQHYLGLCYNDGYGVEQSQEQSFYWLSRVAFEHNDVHAAFHIAMMFLRGYWTSSNASSFSSPTTVNYPSNGNQSQANNNDAVFWIRFAAERGHAEAQANLGIMYAQGSKGLEKNMTEALKWFELAAKEGNPMAQYNAAVCYLHGHGTIPVSHKDEVKAMSLYHVAAENGHPDAQSHLAFCYFNGSNGVKEDLKKGFEWLKKASDVEVHGMDKANLNAIFFTGICYTTGRGTEANPQLGEEYIRLAAERGHPTAREMISAAEGDNNSKA